jgi:hypothetical protein
MDDRQRKLVALIIQEGVDRHSRDTDNRLHNYNLQLIQRRADDRERRKELNAPEPPYESYGSRRWVDEASLLEASAGEFIHRVSEEIRAETVEAEAGRAFADAAKHFRSLLGQRYADRFDMARPFYYNGRNLTLPNYWDKLGPALARKAEIEVLKFHVEDAATTGENTFVPAPMPSSWRGKQSEEYKPYADRAAEMVWFRGAANLHQAAKLIVKSDDPPRLTVDWDNTATYVYKTARKLYDDYTGQLLGVQPK